MLLKVASLERAFQELLYGILHFSVAQKVVDWVIFTSLRFLGKLFD